MTQPKRESNSVLFPLEYIGFCRSQLMSVPGETTSDTLSDFAKWQICKVRNVLFLDPIWDKYTFEDLMIEYFGIMFDENKEYASEFLGKITKPEAEKVYDWFDRMEKRIKKKQAEELEKVEEFEDKY